MSTGTAGPVLPVPQGTVILIGGVFFLIEEFFIENLWENSGSLYLASQLVDIIELNEHDRENGLPGITLIRDDEWISPLDTAYHCIGEETMVILHTPFYLPASLVEGEEVQAMVVEKTLVRAKARRGELIFQRSGQNDLTEEDWECREMCIRDRSSPWRVSPMDYGLVL